MFHDEIVEEIHRIREEQSPLKLEWDDEVKAFSANCPQLNYQL